MTNNSTHPSNRNRWATAATLWLAASTAGCSVYDVNGWKMPEAKVPDVHPMLRERKNDAVKDFDTRRNEAQFLAAQTSWRQGDHERCRESIQKVLDRDPNHRGALLLQADVALETEEPEMAVDSLRRALAAEPDDAEIAYRLGLALETTGKVEEAIPYLRQAADAVPGNQQFADALAEAQRQLTPEAEPVAKPIETAAAEPAVVAPAVPAQTASAPAKPDPEFAAALADWEHDRIVECAGRLTKLLQRRPDHVEANILQAEIELDGGQTAAALHRMDRLIVKYPRSVQVRQAAGLVNEAAGNAEKADLFFAEAESLAEADMMVTVAYEEPMTDAGDGDPTAPQTLAAEVLTLPEVPKLEPAPEAAPLAPEALAREPAVLLGDGQAALTSGKVAEARQLLKAAVARSPDDPQTAVTASIAALKLEQPELALELSSAGATAFPRSAGLHRIRGMAAYRLGRYAEAEIALRESLNLDNSQALSYFLLGSAQGRLGKNESSERNLREAARLDARYALRK